MFSARGYLWAALAATVVLLAVLSIQAIAQGEANLMPNALVLAPIIAGYVFGATLVAGVVGLLLTRALRWKALVYYQGLGSVLGAAHALLVWWSTGNPSYTLGAGIVFAAMGLVASTIYWKVSNRAA